MRSVPRSDMIARVADRIRPAALAGSLLAAPREDQLGYARDLYAAGARLHVDLIDGSYPAGSGVPADVLRDLIRYRDLLDIHLLVSDPIRAVGKILTGPAPARITVQLEDLPDPDPALIDGLSDDCRRAGSELWLGIAPQTDPHRVGPLLERADGVLIMLTTPGSPGAGLQDSMISRVHDVTHRPLAVDGGVSEAIFPDLQSAGVSNIVIGRWLWSMTDGDRSGPTGVGPATPTGQSDLPGPHSQPCSTQPRSKGVRP